MEQENKKSKKKINLTWVLVAVLVIITAILLVVSLTSRGSNPSTSSLKELEKDVAHTSLEFSNSPRVGTVSGTYEMDINIDTDKDKVTLAQLEMGYDPKTLRIIDIKAGDFIKNAVVIQKNVDSGNGRVKFWLGISPSQNGVSGKGTVATISFTKLGSGAAQINFLPKTSVSATGIDQSVLKNMIGGYINILPSPSKSLPTKKTQPTTTPPTQ